EKDPCSVENWMLMPSFGYPIANAFKRPVHYFSRHQCLTFLPDNIPLNRNQPIVFAFIDKQNYYIAMRLKPNAPVPVIVNRWQNICSNQSKIWEKLFEARISRFQKAFEKEHSSYSKDQATIELS
ncbi:12936_t:CDS:1, partial [Cetraspora pellucida]